MFKEKPRAELRGFPLGEPQSVFCLIRKLWDTRLSAPTLRLHCPCHTVTAVMQCVIARCLAGTHLSLCAASVRPCVCKGLQGMRPGPPAPACQLLREAGTASLNLTYFTKSLFLNLFFPQIFASFLSLLLPTTKVLLKHIRTLLIF